MILIPPQTLPSTEMLVSSLDEIMIKFLSQQTCKCHLFRILFEGSAINTVQLRLATFSFMHFSNFFKWFSDVLDFKRTKREDIFPIFPEGLFFAKKKRMVFSCFCKKSLLDPSVDLTFLNNFFFHFSIQRSLMMDLMTITKNVIGTVVIRDSI